MSQPLGVLVIGYQLLGEAPLLAWQDAASFDRLLGERTAPAAFKESGVAKSPVAGS